MRYVDPFGLSEWCYQDGTAVSCDSTNTWLTSGAGVEIPADMPLSFYDGKNFQLLIVGAETPLTYASFSVLSMLNEWNGSFLTNEQFYDMQRANQVYRQHFELVVQKIMAYTQNKYSYDTIAGWINQRGYGKAGAPFIHGGNWNFTLLSNDDNKDLVSSITRNQRIPGLKSLHLHDTGYSHVDTAAGANWYSPMWVIHGLVDVVLGHSWYANWGIPR